jgi:hypothetical protein
MGPISCQKDHRDMSVDPLDGIGRYPEDLPGFKAPDDLVLPFAGHARRPT